MGCSAGLMDSNLPVFSKKVSNTLKIGDIIFWLFALKGMEVDIPKSYYKVKKTLQMRPMMQVCRTYGENKKGWGAKDKREAIEVLTI